MQPSVVTYEKPLPHIGLAEWYGKQWTNQQTNDTRRSDSFNLRYEAKRLRNETKIKTEWDIYHNNERLSDRITELDRWKDTLQACLDKVNFELASLRDEKYSTERELDALGIPIGIVTECISTRDCRQGPELTYDDAETELKAELGLLEEVKKLLIEKCQSAWVKVNKLEEVKFKLTLDINDKREAIAIDTDLLTADQSCANISYRIDPLRIATNSVPYEAWLEQSRYIKILADNELADTNKFREALFLMREHSRNDMIAQRDRVDFTLRKRIYETQRARNEIEWQLGKIRDEMEKVLKEIKTLEGALEHRTNALKFCSTSLENRSYRPGIEMAQDEVEHGLKDEVRQLRQTRIDLQNKIDCAKATYNALEDQRVLVDTDFNNKCHSLMTDIRCLDLRARLKSDEFGARVTNVDRNIELTKLKQEISPT